MPIDDSRPIWVQLVDDFRMRIVTGAWPAGTRIPSVLDRSGLTAAERTAGRFVTADAAALAAVRRELAVGAADTFITAVTAIGMDHAQASGILAERWPATPVQESESGESS